MRWAFPLTFAAAWGDGNYYFANTDWVVTGDLSEAETRGRYLSEALAPLRRMPHVAQHALVV